MKLQLRRYSVRINAFDAEVYGQVSRAWRRTVYGEQGKRLAFTGSIRRPGFVGRFGWFGPIHFAILKASA